MIPEESVQSAEVAAMLLKAHLEDVIHAHEVTIYLLLAARTEVEELEKAHGGDEAGSALLEALYDRMNDMEDLRFAEGLVRRLHELLKIEYKEAR
jgi:predicted DNA-binding protein